MADFKELINELPNLADSLKLNVGDANEISQQIVHIGNVQDKLRKIQEDIEAELGREKFKKKAMGVLPFFGTVVATVFIPGGFLVDAAITVGAVFFAEKFGKSETELTLNDLQLKIEDLVDWGEWLKNTAEEILSDSEIINQIIFQQQQFSLPTQFQRLDESLMINLAFGEAKVLQQQIRQIIQAQENFLQVKQRLNEVINYIENGEDILKILLGFSAFFGKSGFVLEWLDDEHGLIISSNGQLQAVADVIDECVSFKEKTSALILHGNTFRGQAEQALKNLETQNNKIEAKKTQTIIAPQTLEQRPKKSANIKQSILVIGSSLAIFGFGGWMCQNKFPQVQLQSLSFNFEGNAVTNLQSAQKLGMEAAVMVQNPPHTLVVWQQALLKWQQAINLLESIPEGTSVSTQAKKQLLNYRVNHAAISQRLMTESKAAANLESAQKLAMEAAVMVPNPPHQEEVWQQAFFKWQQAINILEAIPSGTFASQIAKEKLSIYKTNYAAIATKLKY
ncbi:hypothetical protein PI95_001350 [Hassallia byssoidea VB512170]|uniref:Uncharacterized protein n=1 Tax=Hassallia byssoidea VB512170 TaxID=1304833 RepID=A0A846H3X7_9CYAN|nr:hypothetical protein [Hassalia byssoidea]NEU71261.1 hypothetical protein [Hassalia byssoidea VB512170]